MRLLSCILASLCITTSAAALEILPGKVVPPYRLVKVLYDGDVSPLVRRYHAGRPHAVDSHVDKQENGGIVIFTGPPGLYEITHLDHEKGWEWLIVEITGQAPDDDDDNGGDDDDGGDVEETPYFVGGIVQAYLRKMNPAPSASDLATLSGIWRDSATALLESRVLLKDAFETINTRSAVIYKQRTGWGKLGAAIESGIKAARDADKIVDMTSMAKAMLEVSNYFQRGPS